MGHKGTVCAGMIGIFALLLSFPHHLIAATGYLMVPGGDLDSLTSASVVHYRSSACPETDGGVVDTVSVAVDDVQPLLVGIPRPAPEGGVWFRIRAELADVAVAGEPRTGYFPAVFIPEGASLSSEFLVRGVSVGATRLQVMSQHPEFNSFAVPLSSWDMGLPRNPLLDANPPFNHCRADDHEIELTTDPVQLTLCGEPLTSAAADGASRLLLRVQAGLSGTVCYRILNQEAPDPGTISANVVQTVPLDGSNFGFSFYTVPEETGTNASKRDITLEVVYTPNLGRANSTRIRAPLELIRPPHVLVHGVWGSSESWLRKAAPYIREDGSGNIYIYDYRDSNAAPFSTNMPALANFIRQSIRNMRRDELASVSRANVTGHSMGGLLARKYVAFSESYFRPDNLGSGDINRLVSLNSPHFGSSFANLLIALHDVRPDATRAALARLIPGAQMDAGAVCDLAENSPAVQALSSKPADLSSHVITSMGGPLGGPDMPADFWRGHTVFGIGSFERQLTRPVFPQDVVDAFRFRESNDAVVGLTSQTGGVGHATNYASLLHFGVDVDVPLIGDVRGVTSSPEVRDWVFALLDQGLMRDRVASEFPMVPLTPDGETWGPDGVAWSVPGQGAAFDAAVFARQCGPGGALSGLAPLRVVALEDEAYEVPPVRIVQPEPGTVVRAGDTLTVVVDVGPEGSTISPGAQVWVDVSMFEELRPRGAGRHEYQVTIPEWYMGVGPHGISTLVYDDGTSAVGVAVNFFISPPDPPVSISVSHRRLGFMLPGGSPQLVSLVGDLADGRQYSFSSLHTGTYVESSDPNVVRVVEKEIQGDRLAYLEPVSPGVAIVKVKNGKATDQMAVLVEQEGTPWTPEELTHLVDIRVGSIALDRRSGMFVTEFTMTNDGHLPLPGPLYVTLEELSEGVRLANASGYTRRVEPVGMPFIRAGDSGGLGLMPGQTVSYRLEFLNSEHRRITFTPKVWRMLTIGP